MSGKVNGPRTEEHDKVFLSNLSLAATKLRNKGITGLIEPINNYSVPDYFLNSYKQGTVQMMYTVAFYNMVYFRDRCSDSNR